MHCNYHATYHANTHVLVFSFKRKYRDMQAALKTVLLRASQTSTDGCSGGVRDAIEAADTSHGHGTEHLQVQPVTHVCVLVNMCVIYLCILFCMHVVLVWEIARVLFRGINKSNLILLFYGGYL